MSQTTIKLDRVMLSIKNDIVELYFEGIERCAFVDYSPEMVDLLMQARFRVPTTDSARNAYKYPYSNAYKKTLGQMVFDFYFGEDKRKNLYKNRYTIKHQDGDGFNCKILNLTFSKGPLPLKKA